MSTDYGSLNAEMIGIALGSPCQTPLPVVHTAEVDEPRSTCRSPESTSTVQSDSNKSSNPPEKEKSQRTKWKNFGGLFRKKSDPCPPSSPLYKVELSFQQDRQRPHQPYIHFTPVVEDEKTYSNDTSSAFDSSHTAARTSNGPSSTAHPDIGITSPRRMRSFRSKLREKQAETPFRPATQRSRTMPAAVEEMGPMRLPWGLNETIERGPAIPRTNPASLLEVEIPSVKLERYSVMFSGLLPPKSYSLSLAEKQAQKEDTRSIDMADGKAPPSLEKYCLPPPGRPRITSTERSPSFSLFPSAPPRRGCSPGRKQPLERSPLHRSITVTGLTSPRRTKFEQDLERPQSPGQGPVAVVVHSPSADSRALDSREPRMGAYDLSRHSQASTEASFHSAHETQHIEVGHGSINGQRGLPKRTSSVKVDERSRMTRSEHDNVSTRITSSSGSARFTSKVQMNQSLGSKPVSDIRPLNLNPPTPRILGREDEDSNSYFSGSSMKPLIAEAVRYEKRTPGKNDRLESRSRSARASSATRTPVQNTRSAQAATSVSAQSSSTSSPVPPARTTRTQAKPTEQKPTVPQMRLPPLDFSETKSPDDLNKAAIKSIARQISNSQRQRERLVPIVPKVARQPIPVDVRGGAMARKSQHLVLDNA